MTHEELEALTIEDLDSRVHDAKSLEAVNINNSGKDAQIAYLLNGTEEA